MEPNLKIALIPAASAIAGGVITAIVAPHIAWGIEKKKQKFELRRKLVADWRRMIKCVNTLVGCSTTAFTPTKLKTPLQVEKGIGARLLGKYILLALGKLYPEP